MSPYFNNQADTQIRIMSALCYMSSGIIGLIYILLNGKNNKSQFFMFHFMQALLIGIFMVLIGWAGGGISGFVMGFFGLFGSSLASVANIVGMGLALTMQLLTVVLIIADVWGIIQCLRGKFADMPVVSKIVRSNLR
jgi:uncharacterized membrane protein